MIKQCLTIGIFVALLAACSVHPDAYTTRGNPENLLDLSSERISLAIDSEESIEELITWINEDQPSKAELHCISDHPLCLEAEAVFDQFGLSYEYHDIARIESAQVALVYERVVARDCDNRFVDTLFNPRHLNHPTFGCSNAANIVQMVGDQQQFFDPSLSDFQDAEHAVDNFNHYLAK